MEPRVTAARKVAELSKKGGDASGDAPEADPVADHVGDDAPSEPNGLGEEGAMATGKEVPFVDLEEEKRLLAVIESILSCRSIVNKWNDDRQHRENLAKAKNASAEAEPELTNSVAALLGGGAGLRKMSSKFKSSFAMNK